MEFWREPQASPQQKSVFSCRIVAAALDPGACPGPRSGIRRGDDFIGGLHHRLAPKKKDVSSALFCGNLDPILTSGCVFIFSA
jgi:hypothetical protein